MSDFNQLTESSKTTFKLFSNFFRGLKTLIANDKHNEAINNFCNEVLRNQNLTSDESLYNNLGQINKQSALLQGEVMPTCEPSESPFKMCRSALENAASISFSKINWGEYWKAAVLKEYPSQWLFPYTDLMLNLIRTERHATADQMGAIKCLINILDSLKKEAEKLYPDYKNSHLYKFKNDVQTIKYYLKQLNEQLKPKSERETLEDKTNHVYYEVASLIEIGRNCLSMHALGADKFNPLYDINENNVRQLRDGGNVQKKYFIDGCYSVCGVLLFLTIDQDPERTEPNRLPFIANIHNSLDRVQALFDLSKTLEYLSKHQIYPEHAANKMNSYVNRDMFKEQGGVIKHVEGSHLNSNCAPYNLAVLWGKKTNQKTEVINDQINHLYTLYAQFCLRLTQLTQVRSSLAELSEQAGNLGQITISYFRYLRHLYLKGFSLCSNFCEQLKQISQYYNQAIHTLHDEIKNNIDPDGLFNSEFRALSNQYIDKVDQLVEQIENQLDKEYNVFTQIDRLKDKLDYWCSQKHIDISKRKIDQIHKALNNLENQARQQGDVLPEQYNPGSLSRDAKANFHNFLDSFKSNSPNCASSAAASASYEQDCAHLQREWSAVFSNPSEKKSESSNNVQAVNIKDNILSTFEVPSPTMQVQILKTLDVQTSSQPEANIVGSHTTWQLIVKFYAYQIYKTLKQFGENEDSKNAQHLLKGLIIPTPSKHKLSFLSFPEWAINFHAGNLTDILNSVTHMVSESKKTWRGYESSSTSDLEKYLSRIGLIYNACGICFRENTPILEDNFLVQPIDIFDFQTIDSKDDAYQALSEQWVSFKVLILLRLLMDHHHNNNETILYEGVDISLNIQELHQLAIQVLYEYQVNIEYPEVKETIQQDTAKWLTNQFEELHTKLIEHKRQQQENNHHCDGDNNQDDSLNNRPEIPFSLKEAVNKAANEYAAYWTANQDNYCRKRSYINIKHSLDTHTDASYDLYQLLVDIYGRTGKDWRAKGQDISLRVRMIQKINHQLAHNIQVDKEHESSPHYTKEIIKGYFYHYCKPWHQSKTSLINNVVDVIYNRLLNKGEEGQYNEVTPRIDKAAHIMQLFENVLIKGYQYADLPTKLYQRWDNQSIGHDDNLASPTTEQNDLEHALDTFISRVDNSTSYFKSFFLSDTSYTSAAIKRKIEPQEEEMPHNQMGCIQ